jgi:hypothetical protein
MAETLSVGHIRQRKQIEGLKAQIRRLQSERDTLQEVCAPRPRRVASHRVAILSPDMAYECDS